MKHRFFKRAARLYSSSKYREALRLLEPEILAMQDEPAYFLLMGLCCIQCRSIGDAITYLRRGLRIDDRDCGLLQAMAVCAYIQNKRANSVRHALAVLDIDPRYRRAALFLQFLKTQGGGKRGRAQIRNTQSFLPRAPYAFAGALRVAAAIAIIVAIGTASALLVPPLLNQNRADRSVARAGVEEIIDARNLDQYIDLAVNSRYVFNDARVAELLATIERDFLARADNEVCVNINRLLNSNAHAQIKQRMIFLSSYLDAPTFAQSTLAYTYTEVSAEPHLYSACYVRWRGTVANVRATREGVTEFDFLVGYESGDVLEGVAESVSDVAYDFRDNNAYEVIAQVSGKERGNGASARTETTNEVTLYIVAIRPLTEE